MATQTLINLVKTSEGCKLTAYQDTGGIWTIGYGATFYQNNLPVKQGDSISQETADELLAFHLDYFTALVKKECPPTLNQNELDALTDFAYNCGNQNLLVSTLLKEVSADILNPDISFQFNRWNKDGKGNVLPGLVTRRAAESKLYFTPA